MSCRIFIDKDYKIVYHGKWYSKGTGTGNVSIAAMAEVDTTGN